MNTPDILIHVHPNTSAEKRSQIENAVLDCAGVIAADFDHHPEPHALMVVYNSDAISERQILETVRKFDPVATMVGL